jgi:hypothetical protein
MNPSRGWAFSMETLFFNRASMLAATEVGGFLLMILPDQESEEIMATWSSDDAPITDAVISYNEFIDKAARKLLLPPSSLFREAGNYTRKVSFF